MIFQFLMRFLGIMWLLTPFYRVKLGKEVVSKEDLVWLSPTDDHIKLNVDDSWKCHHDAGRWWGLLGSSRVLVYGFFRVKLMRLLRLLLSFMQSWKDYSWQWTTTIRSWNRKRMQSRW